uniref:Uncharacterized protein n=1 Tax=Pararge aegeria TaxID=116150 RepID=S4PJ63_9NEOP
MHLCPFSLNLGLTLIGCLVLEVIQLILFHFQIATTLQILLCINRINPQNKNNKHDHNELVLISIETLKCITSLFRLRWQLYFT